MITLTDIFTQESEVVHNEREALEVLNDWADGNLPEDYYAGIVEMLFHGDAGQATEALLAHGVVVG